MDQAKEAYQGHLVSSYSNSPGSLFRHLSDMISANTIPSTLNFEGVYESDPAIKCALFNSFFNSVSTQATSTLDSPTNSQIPNTVFDCLDISEADVYKVLSTLDPHKAPGPDGNSPVYLNIVLRLCLSHYIIFFSICKIGTITLAVETFDCSRLQVRG